MSAPFPTPKDAALALIRLPAAKLNRRSGQFLGQLAFGPHGEPLSEKQDRWLNDLLAAHDLPGVADGGAHE